MEEAKEDVEMKPVSMPSVTSVSIITLTFIVYFITPNLENCHPKLATCTIEFVKLHTEYLATRTVVTRHRTVLQSEIALLLSITNKVVQNKEISFVVRFLYANFTSDFSPFHFSKPYNYQSLLFTYRQAKDYFSC
jgi:hypothetical protein